MAGGCEYPTISVTEGQFAIIDGFLVSFCPKRSAAHPAFDSISTETREKVRKFVCIYKPDATLKMQRMSSNFYIVGNHIIFDLVKEKVPVNFVKARGRYYCRKVNPQKATHIALKIRISAKKAPQSSKYVVLEVPLKRENTSRLALLRQQSDDLSVISSGEIEEAFNFLVPDIDVSDLDIKLLGADGIIELSKKSVRPTIVEQAPADLEDGRKRKLARESLQSMVLQFSKRRTACKLEKMKKVLLEVPSFVKHSVEMEAFYEQSKARAMQNLSLASMRVFMPLLDLFANTDSGKYEKISDRFVVVDQLLVDVPSKMVLNPLGQSFLNSATTHERTKLSEHILLSWDKIRGGSEPLKVRSAKLLDIMGFTSNDEHLKAGSLSQETTVVRASIGLTRYKFKLNFENLGLKQVFVETIGNAGLAAASPENTSAVRSEHEKLSRPHLAEFSPSDLLQRFQQFCAYEEQLDLYLEILGSMIGRKLSYNVPEPLLHENGSC